MRVSGNLMLPADRQILSGKDQFQFHMDIVVTALPRPVVTAASYAVDVWSREFVYAWEMRLAWRCHQMVILGAKPPSFINATYGCHGLFSVFHHAPTGIEMRVISGR